MREEDVIAWLQCDTEDNRVVPDGPWECMTGESRWIDYEPG